MIQMEGTVVAFFCRDYMVRFRIRTTRAQQLLQTTANKQAQRHRRKTVRRKGHSSAKAVAPQKQKKGHKRQAVIK